MSSEPSVPKPIVSLNAIIPADAGVSTVSPAEPIRSVFGAVKERNCAREVKRFATRITKLFAPEIASDPRGFKKSVTAILKRNLPPFPGRPTEQSITSAVTLRRGGQDWKQIYPQVIPNHANLDPAVRRQAESNLRASVRSRRNARQRRKHIKGSIAKQERVQMFLFRRPSGPN